jgi:mRNA interferase YafQ
MYKVKFTTAYRKSYKLMKKRGLDLSLLDHIVDELRQGHSLDENQRRIRRLS